MSGWFPFNVEVSQGTVNCVPTAQWETRRTPPACSPAPSVAYLDGLQMFPDPSQSVSQCTVWSQGSLGSFESQETPLSSSRQRQNRRFRPLRCPPASWAFLRPLTGVLWCGLTSRGGGWYRPSIPSKKNHSKCPSWTPRSRFSRTRTCGYFREDTGE